MFIQNKNLKERLDLIILVFLCIFLVGFFNEHLTAIKNIGITISIIFIFVEIIIYRNLIFDKEIFTSKEFILFMCLLVIMFISSYSPYDSSLPSIDYFFKEIKYSLLFLIVIVFLPNKEKNLRIIFYSFLLTMILLETHFLIKSNIFLIFKSDYIVERLFSTFFEVSFPFLLAMFLSIHKKKYKVILFTVIIIGMVMLFYTGVRGSWLAIFVESLILGIAYLVLHKNKVYITMKYIFSFLFIFGIFILYLYNTSSVINSKINRGIDSNLRDLIIKERFPLFIENNEYKILGIGYGTEQYISFLNDKKAPYSVGKKDDKTGKFIYFHDEPYLMSFFYHHGIIGGLFFILFSFIFVYSIIKFFMNNKNQKEILFSIAILSSFLGVFLIRGLFENMHFKYLIILFALYVFIKKSNKESNDTSIYIS